MNTVQNQLSVNMFCFKGNSMYHLQNNGLGENGSHAERPSNLLLTCRSAQNQNQVGESLGSRNEWQRNKIGVSDTKIYPSHRTQRLSRGKFDNAVHKGFQDFDEEAKLSSCIIKVTITNGIFGDLHYGLCRHHPYLSNFCINNVSLLPRTFITTAFSEKMQPNPDCLSFCQLAGQVRQQISRHDGKACKEPHGTQTHAEHTLSPSPAGLR